MTMFVDKVLAAKKSVYLEFAIVFAVALLARGADIFSLHWSCDDFLSIADPDGHGYVASQAAQLRIFAALTTWLLGWLGTGFPPIGSFWSACHTASMIVFALALRRLWIPGSASIYGVLLALLFALFPYHINLLSFQLQHPSMVMSYLTGAYGIVNFNQSGVRRWLAFLAIAASLSYQTMISYFIAAGLVMLLIQLVRHQVDQGKQSLADHLRPVLAYAITILIGLLAYFLLSFAAVHLFAVPVSGRTKFAAFDQWPFKLQLIVNHLKRTAFGVEPSMARSTKLLQSFLWLIVATGFVGQFVRRPGQRGRSFWFLLLFSLVSVLMIASAFLPTILMDHTSENPRNLLATVVFAAGLLALSSLLASYRLRSLAVVVASVLALSYASITNLLSVDQARLSQRDFLQANRMVERLDLLTGQQPLRTVVLLGNTSPRTGLRGSEYFQSGFEVNWAKLPLLREASGRSFDDPSASDQAKAEALAANRPAWPAKESVAVQGDLGLVVLSRP